MAKKQPQKRKKKIVPESGGLAAISLSHATETKDVEKIEGPVITIKYKYLVMAAYLYLVLPILIFFVTWLRWYIGFPMAIVLTYGLYCLLKKDYLRNEQIIKFPRRTVIAGAIIVFVFLFFTGQGGFFFQYSDNYWRNATLHDLVYFSWPVIYTKTNNALVYYIMHWIFPAMIGKLFNHSFLVARIALLLWTYMGILFSLALICNYLKAQTRRNITIVLTVFLGWGGLNIIGGIISNIFGLTEFALNTYGWWTNFTVDGQGYGFMFRSTCDQLASVYNQTIAPWIAVPLLLDKPKIRTFVFLGLCVLPYSPLPFLGLVIIMCMYAVLFYKDCIKKKLYKDAIIETFSIPNISAFCTLFIVFLLYFKCNVNAATGAHGKAIDLYIPPQKFSWFSVAVLLLFYILQFGIFAFLIRSDHRGSTLFRTIIVIMMLVPFVKVGTVGDFCWNVSVPAYFTLMIMVMKYLMSHWLPQSNSAGKNIVVNKNVIGLIICLTLTLLNPITQIGFGFKIAYQEKTFHLMCNNIKTFSDKQIGDELPGLKYSYMDVYLVPDPETKAFYKYFARK